MANSVPTLTGLTTPVTFLENAAPQIIAADVTFTDPDNNFNGGTLKVTGLLAQDTVAIRNQGTGAGQIGVSGGNVTFGGSVIGSFAGGAGSALTVTFNAAATAAGIEALIENLTYANSSDAPAASHSLELKVTDAAGFAAIAPIAFAEQTGAANPFNGVDVGLTSTPSFADLDGDGDLDAVVGEGYGNLNYFENTGTAIAPAFTARTGAANPLNAVNVGGYSAPSFADLDGDGDLDAVVGELFGTLHYFENTGSASAPPFTALTGAANPFAGVDVGSISVPSFADLDGDGDLDAVVGEGDGNLNYFENTGTAITAAFTERTGAANPFDGVVVGARSTPSFADLDGDGDLDAVVGEVYGILHYFENTGTAIAPAFTERTGAANPFDGVDVGFNSTPSFADLDGDGGVDAVVGASDGTLHLFANTTPHQPAPDFAEQTSAANPFNTVDVGDLSTPSFADLDGDGDLDAVVGEDAGNLNYFENTGSAIAPAFTARTGAANPFNGIDVGIESTPSFADLDGDGDLDAVVGEVYGTLHYFENTGSASAPAFTARTGAANPFNGVDVGDDSTPSFADLDGDGDLDAVVGETAGNLNYFENTGTATAPAFTARTGAADPFNAVDVGGFSTPSFADLDGDGDLDAVVGEQAGTLNYFENTGSATAPAFAERTGAANPFNGVDVGSFSAPSFADLDGDGDPDAVVGESDGILNFFWNTTPQQPAADFAEQTGAANPFNTVDVGNLSTPSFADLDGDGDLDAVVGENFGTLNYFENTGTTSSPVFTERTGAANPLDGVDVGFYGTPSFADLDGDGDLDAVVGEYLGTLHYFENTGSAIAPAFTERTGAANPFNGVNAGYLSTPSFADLDGDGDLDAIVGSNYGTLHYFKNTGSAMAPAFTEQTGTANPFNGVNVGFSSAPSFADLDGDSDLDAVVGANDGTLRYFENTGSAIAAAFTARTGAANPFNTVDVGGSSAPSFADLDGDGDLDAIVGANDGTLNYFKNTGAGFTQVVNVTAQNDAATLSADVRNLTETDAATAISSSGTLTISDPDSPATFVVQAGTIGSYGTFAITSAGAWTYTASSAHNEFAAGTTYTDTFPVASADGTLTSVTINILGSNDAAVLTGLTTPVTFLENTVNAAAQIIDADVTFTDLDNNFNGGTLTVTGLLAQDTVAIRNQGTGAGQIGVSGGNVSFGGSVIGSFAGGAGSALSVTFNAAATAAGIEALIENLTYANSSDAPIASRGLELKVTDAAGFAAIAPLAFAEQTGAANPFNGASFDVGFASTPNFADLDGDGDLDAVVGEGDGNLNYFENTGTAIAPAFTARTGAANPFDGVNVGNESTPSFADLDGDGDLDAVVGASDGTLHYFENTGTATAPAFTERTGAANPLDAVIVGGSSTPSFADLDGDGDLDAVVGASDGTLRYFENNGSALAPAFIERTGTANPFNTVDVGFRSTPSFADLDGDGDLDAVVGEYDGSLHLFENTGSATAPAFTARTGAANPFNGVGVVGSSTPSFADLDGDGDLDAVVGEAFGTLHLFANTTPQQPAADFAEQTGAANPFNGVDVGGFSAPGFADLDGDGDLDAVVGEFEGNLNYFENTGSATAPAFTARTGAANPLDGVDVGIFSHPSFADLDGDGDLDAVVGERYGTLRYFENTGSAIAPAFTARTGAANPFNGVGVAGYSAPSFADLDGDGDLDAVVGEDDGTLHYFENTGTATAPAFTARTGAANPFNGVDVGELSKPSFADLDGDGDLDAVVGERYGALRYFENTGSAMAPTFTEQTGAANPFDGVDVGYTSTPSFADLDGDGDLDAVVGASGGTLRYFENTGAGFALVVNVTAQNDAAVLSPDARNLTETNAAAAISDSGTLTISDVDSPATFVAQTGTLGNYGTFAITSAGAWTYTASSAHNEFAAGTTYTDTFQVASADGTPTTVTINILGTNDAAVLSPDVRDLSETNVALATSGTLTVSDVDSPASFVAQAGTLGSYGTFAIDSAGAWTYTASSAHNEFAAGTTYTDTFQVASADGTLTSVTINIAGSNDAAVLTGLTTPVTFLENTVNAAAQIIDADVTFTDPDNNFDGGTLTVTGLLAQDTVAIRNQGTGAGEIGVSGSDVSFGGSVIGSFAGGAGSALAVTFNAAATAAGIEALIENLTYANSSDAPTASRSLELKITDAAGFAAIAPLAFAEQTGAANPFNGVDVGDVSTPSFADLDGDGDLDAVVGEGFGTLHYFENTGSAIAPAFTEITGAANPFSGVVGFENTPSFADLDGDGDLDAVVGETLGSLRYFENTGTAAAPSFTEITGTANPFDGVNAWYTSTPSFADLDGDGDLDAVVGELDGSLHYFENTGSASAPAFIERTGAANPFNGVDVGDHGTPTFADLDGDGDLDAVVGETDGNLNYFENTGSATAPAFTARTGAANPFDGASFDVGAYSAPSFADLDGDGDLDAIVGELDGNLNYFRNTTPHQPAPDFVQQAGAANPFDGVDLGYLSTPSFADLDGDGDLDAVVGKNDGTLHYFENTGSAITAAFTERTGAANPFNGADVGYNSAPSFADLDGDGDLDAVAGEDGGTLHYFENTGSTTAPAFTARTGAASPFDGVNAGFRSTPSFADLDGDGDLDAVVGEGDGTLNYFENTGSAIAPAFTERTGAANPLDGVNAGYNSTPSFADLDGDGDLDAVVGEFNGNLHYFENTGTASAPAFSARTGAASPFDGVNVGIFSTTSLADIDGDGDPDVVVGEFDGTLNYFRNTGAGFALVVDVTAQNYAAVLSTDVRNLTETNAAADISASGMLTISDADSPATFVAQVGTVGSYGTFAIDSAGAWTYTASSAHDAFVAGTTYTDTFQVASADGTLTSVTINILGSNDAAVLSADVRNLTETNAAADISASGTLTVSDVDSPASFVAQAATVGNYGTFAIDSAGAWTYTASSAHNEFAAGTTYTDTFPVASADVTLTSVTINILGSNDAAVLSADVRNLTETNAAADISASGTLTVSDVDSPASFVAQAATVGNYGTFAIDSAGAWTYTASSAHNEFAAGTTYTDTFPVASADVTLTSVTINILGTNDAAVLSTDVRNLTETNAAAAISDSGTLTISDADSPATFVAQPGTLGNYGTFAITSAGAWTYTASSAHDEFVAGTTYTDTFQVASADGTPTSVTINILGTNEAAALSTDVRNLTETNAAADISDSGTLTISDADSPATFVAQVGTVGSYGTFAIDSAGAWTYTASSAHDAFVAGTTYTDTFQVASADGTPTSVTINILGTNDAAVLSTDVRNVTETNAAAAISASGTLTISDVDSAATFVAQAGTLGSYGTFAITSAGAWTYTASSAHNEFAVGTTYTDTFQVASADGTSTSVTINILGTNDAAVLSTDVRNLTETNAAAAISDSGTLTISDVDSPTTFVAQAATVGNYGTFAIDSAGAWTYTASSAHNAFVAGTTYTDTFQVASADGTPTSVTINIAGTNDAAVLSADVRNLTETNAAADISSSGTLTISDVDSAATFVAQAGTVGLYGTFAITSAGAWTYTASSAHDAFVAGTTYTDTFQVASADGTPTSVTINILGTNDAAVLSTDVRNVTETNAAADISASGTLTISDVDSAATFVAQAGTLGSYGTFAIDSAGAWTYTASSAHNEFAVGTTYTDTFQVASADGTPTSVTINILGTTDAAAWHDFSSDSKSDILWQNGNGTAAVWLMDGTSSTFVGAVGPFNPGPAWHIEGIGDFNGDSKSDIVWQHDNGAAALWLLDGTNVTFAGQIGPFNPGPSWEIKGIGDFNGDGKSDIIWQGDNGTAAMWLMDGTNATFAGAVGPFNPGPSWHIEGTGDFNGDGKSDIIWQGDNGAAAMWLMDGTNATFVGAVGSNPGPNWHIEGTGDFNGDGKSDILWQGQDGTPAIWLMDGTNVTFAGAVGPFNPGPSWHIEGTGDFNGDSKADILWQHDNGTPVIWTMDGTNVVSIGAAGSFNPGSDWHVII